MLTIIYNEMSDWINPSCTNIFLKSPQIHYEAMLIADGPTTLSHLVHVPPQSVHARKDYETRKQRLQKRNK